jgi:dihydrofolate reductase
MLRAIAAVSAEWGIGRDGNLLFHISGDLHRFKALTTGQTVIMGRSTLDSLPGGRPLPKRRNLVLTRDRTFQREGAEVFHDVDSLFSALSADESAWVIGGASVYELLLPRCAELYLTRVDAAPPADRFFPALGEEWVLAEASDWQEEEGLGWRFERYERC